MDNALLNQLFSITRIKTFRKLQKEICLAALLEENIIALLPTGYGKTLCYLIPALMNKNKYLIKTTFIISPTIALIQDQLRQLQEMNLSVIHLNSNNSEQNIKINSILDGSISFVLLTAEKLILSIPIIQLLQKLSNKNMLGRFIIDEAHCISLYGHHIIENLLIFFNCIQMFQLLH